MPPSGDAPTDLFLSLTPHKVLEAVEASGVLCNPVCYPLNSFENRVYEVECEDKTRLVAKFYRPGRWSRAQILAEHRFLAELEEAEVPVCPTVRFSDGETLKNIDHIAYCLFRRMGGRAPEELDDALAERLGRLAARIHNVGAARPGDPRVRLSGDTLGADVHRIHGDLHLGNLLLRDGLFHVFDFDDMMVGPAVQDLWLLLPGRDAETRHLRNVFVGAYEELRHFDRGSLRLIEPLRGLRMIHYAAWIARRFHDPIFPRTFVHFGTDAYWDEQTRDLEELCEVIRVEDGGASPVEETPAHTNKDYFWDMD